MQKFNEALVCKEKNKAIPKELDYFGKLIGSWNINYIDHNDDFTLQGEWHFSWILEGMAIQDVIILPEYECGTSLRIYNPNTQAWDIAYGFTGKIIWLEAKKQDDMIVLTFLNDERRKWVFKTIEDQQFHWQNITVTESGEWQINVDMYGERML